MRKDLLAFLTIALLLVLPLQVSLRVATSHTKVSFCDRQIRKHKNSKMAKLCIKRPSLVEEIQNGIRLGQKECAYQFRHRRWNCTLEGRKQIMAKDTRETAFVHAITAAHVAYTVTKACIMDKNCKCIRRGNTRFVNPSQTQQTLAENTWQQQQRLELLTKSHLAGNVSSSGAFVGNRKSPTSAVDMVTKEGRSFKWGDCSNNIKYGVKMFRLWLDSRIKKKSRNDIRTKIMLHNYLAGTLAIQRYMKQECKCHGLSASCTFSVCFSRMPPFREIGNRLRERFDGAVKVIYGNDGHSSSFIQADETIKRATDEDLVYTDESPDFCVKNLNLGVQGVAERKCNETSPGEDGCPIMCCGFKSMQQIKTVVEVNDQCEFIWCCYVTCKTRNITRIDHFCPSDMNRV